MMLQHYRTPIVKVKCTENVGPIKTSSFLTLRRCLIIYYSFMDKLTPYPRKIKDNEIFITKHHNARERKNE